MVKGNDNKSIQQRFKEQSDEIFKTREKSTISV